MSPHAMDDTMCFASDQEPPRLINGGYSGIDTPTSNGTTSSEISSVPSEPIAIVGMGCRLPGDVRSAPDLWNFLTQKRSGQGEVPLTRWNIESFYHPDGNEKDGSMNMRGGYFINEDLRNFENDFFGINNLEATYMDPQQRKLLEVVFECLESAGIRLEDVSGANVGTYVGSFTTDYWIMQARDPEYWSRYNATGMGTTILANRISHIFNLKGPSFVLDTACSSSLYGLHLACAALDAGECESAIVAAANLIQSPEQHIGTMKAGVLSPTGTCHTFDSSADGYGRADGVGALYLKKLSKAIADGDPIRSVIRGTAVNSNGRTLGITLPSADGQEAVIRKAYEKAGLTDNFSETDYVECHGTGTPVGDPIEVEAVSRVFRGDKSSSREPLLVGSVKTNMGHSEAASGITSIIKATLALENGCVPASIGVKKVNPKIKLDEWGIKIATEQTDLPIKSAKTHTGAPIRRVGINSFGYGGANSHAIIDSPEGYLPHPAQKSSEILSTARSKFLIPLSASSTGALDRQAQNLATMDLEEISVVDLAHTLGTRRSALTQRSFALVGHRSMKEDLDPEHFMKTGIGSFSKLPIAFVFTGQGAQWPQMGKELVEEFPSFRRTIQDLDSILQTISNPPSWTLQQALLDPKETSQISHVTRSQPVCTAIQIAYVQLLARWGINPVGVIGHSSGEIGAAYAARRLTAAQAIIIAYYRGYVVGKSTNTTPGGMMAAGLSKEAADAVIEDLDLVGSINTACVNSPESVTISGDASGIEKMLAVLQGRGVFARKLNTNGRAYHSHHMALIGEEYQDLLEKELIKWPVAQMTEGVRWISSVYAQELTGKVLASYWRKNLESPVLFSAAVEGLVKAHELHLVEIGPHSALELPIKQVRSKLGLTESNIHYTTALSRGKNATDCVLNLMGQLYLHGHEVEFAKVNHFETVPSSNEGSLQQGKVLTSLPPYAWTYDGVLWSESRASQEFRYRKHAHHDLLGSQSLGSNGHSIEWRNVLKIKDIPWVEGHRLRQDVVFPGAGYLAMAIEAVCQISGVTSADEPSFALRQFSISKALQLSTDANAEGVEVFTTLSPKRLSGNSYSQNWYEFAVMSYDNGKSVSHAQGTVSIDTDGPMANKYPSSHLDLESLATRNWYSRFQNVGLNFGPSFQTMSEIKTHRQKKIMHTRAQVPFLQGGGPGKTKQSDYVIHPITIDTIFQAAIIASSAGLMKDLTCKVPTFIESARFKAPKSTTEGQMWTVDSVSQPVGFSAIMIAGELHDGQGQVCAQIENVSAVTFQSADLETAEEERHPMLRVIWKPDISKLQPYNLAHFLKYINAADSIPPIDGADATLHRLASVVDLFAHQNPRIRILEIGEPNVQVTKALMQTLRAESAFRRYGTFSRAYLSDRGELEEVTSAEDLSEKSLMTKPSSDNKYDLVIATATSGQEYCIDRVESVKKLLAPGGAMLGLLPREVPMTSDEPNFQVTDLPLEDSPLKFAFARLSPQEAKTTKQHEIVLVEREGTEAFNDLLLSALSNKFGRDIKRISLHKLLPNMVPPKTTVISTVELKKPLLATLTDSESINVKVMTDNATNLIWLTGGNLMSGGNPDMSLVFGLARALMLEQPSLRFFTFDIDKADADPGLSVQNCVNLVEEAHNIEGPDFETVQHEGLLHISRFVPEEALNATFRQKQNNEVTSRRLGDSKPSRLTIQSVGQFDTLRFEGTAAVSGDLKADHVEVEIKSIGLNAKDVAVFTGKSERKGRTSSSECAGVVTKVGKDVTAFKRGDRVVVMALGHFATVEAFPEWTCEKLRDDEAFGVVSTLPVAFATAMFALDDCARLQRNESILIHAGTQDVSIAAIQMAQLKGAEVYTTVESDDGLEILVKNYAVPRDHIFKLSDPHLSHAILTATQNRGVDVILNCLTGDRLQDSLRCCARFGRFVEMGNPGITDVIRLDIQRNITFTTVDLNEMYDTRDSTLAGKWQGLLGQVMMLYRGGSIKAFEPLVFDASDLSGAFRTFSTKEPARKVVLSFEDDESLVKVLPLKYDSTFSSEKTYLMIGCLGGLGRSISKWMIKQGARKFVFLGRSGMDKAPARKLVEDLENSGAMVQVVRGDVGKYADVEKCVEVIDGDIGGVIQAAMGLNEALWTTMSNEYWHTGIDPKLLGTHHLHRAIAPKSQNLDFFLLTSSISGSVGTATESNYCAANYFLDIFARYRRAQSLPATSVGLGMISEVGYLHENPEIEALLLRKGIQAINEDELLQIIDCAVSNPYATASVPATDSLAAAHLLTGLEPHGIRKMRAQGFAGTNPTLSDPRASLLASALDNGNPDAASLKNNNNSGLPPELAAALLTANSSSILDTIVSLITKRFANLVLVPVEKIDRNRPLGKFGMDSMLAAEFRGWFYQAFRVDVPFLRLLDAAVTIGGLGAIVEKEVGKGQGGVKA